MPSYLKENRRIRVKRFVDNDGPIHVLYSSIPAQVFFRKSTIVSDEGVLLGADGDAVVSPDLDIDRRDVIQILPDLEAHYRVEDMEEIQNAGGRVVAMRLRFARNKGFE